MKSMNQLQDEHWLRSTKVNLSMTTVIKRIPLPASGVMLGMAALGNLLVSYGEWIRPCCGALATLILLGILLKLLLFPKRIQEDMNNPIMASVAATFPMALMILSTYAKPFIGGVAYYLWIFAVLLHLLLIVYFTLKFIVKLQMPKVFASYFIVYVGIVTASITAPAYDMQAVGSIFFWFGFASLLALLVLVSYRYIRFKEVPEPAKPLICIYAAPTSLCLAGYIQSVSPRSFPLIMGMFLLASLLYLFSLIQAIKYLRLPFYPSYASFTFPFVISAIATKMTMGVAAGLGHPVGFLNYVVLIQTLIASAFVAYSYLRFVGFIFSPSKE